ncbi:MAG: hypothetical protein A2934_04435 [Candidatus Sungbacteria bacterium RIFCSPLOWO2_01_FULL_47_10]|uniref:RNA polymerase sigma factor n=1 Tax=Candidatus Sungbacteria bacterium RIFCSPLOWO2_01_FULL_47_10 TaxID=1802276 RepID=A0A1G2L287_9BACT|nr:MAG: hypothetical protein A2934_04435 [Candidatus Sungbacteria bacterium RIFCSPLOWO2_01_FULL_47_10]
MPEEFNDNNPENAHDELILDGSQRDPRLFEILVQKYQAPFLRTAMRIVHQKEEAEDIVQETFIKIYSKAKLFKKRQGASFKSWAYAILVNTAISHIRKYKRSRVKDMAWDPVLDSVLPDPSGLEDIERREIQSVLLGVLKELPPELKTVLEMRYFDDDTYQAIAAKTGLSLENVKIRLHRAKKAAREIISNFV